MFDAVPPKLKVEGGKGTAAGAVNTLVSGGDVTAALWLTDFAGSTTVLPNANVGAVTLLLLPTDPNRELERFF